MSGWLARLRRVETLDAEVASLREAVTREVERVRAEGALSTLADRLVALHEIAVADAARTAAALALFDARLVTVETGLAAIAAAGQDEAIAGLRASLVALERQTRSDVAQADRAMAALRDRIEAVRRAALPDTMPPA